MISRLASAARVAVDAARRLIRRESFFDHAFRYVREAQSEAEANVRRGWVVDLLEMPATGLMDAAHAGQRISQSPVAPGAMRPGMRPPQAPPPPPPQRPAAPNGESAPPWPPSAQPERDRAWQADEQAWFEREMLARSNRARGESETMNERDVRLHEERIARDELARIAAARRTQTNGATPAPEHATLTNDG